SLRLLGRLDEELSCANSRFFRLLLYPDSDVRRLLHDKFVLHWQSVRPVPIITIDLGNGHTIRRTITGSSSHYVVLPTGEVVDGLPGLFPPEIFHSELKTAAEACQAMLAASTIERERALTLYRKQMVTDLEKQWRHDIGVWSLAADLPQAAD